MWRSFQNYIFLSTPSASTILPLWLFASNGGLVYPASSVALPRSYNQKKKGRSQHALLILLFIATLLCYLYNYRYMCFSFLSHTKSLSFISKLLLYCTKWMVPIMITFMLCFHYLLDQILNVCTSTRNKCDSIVFLLYK